MQYKISSGLLFGGLMYYLGGQDILQGYYKLYQQSKKIDNKNNLKTETVSNSTQKIANNTFTADAVTPIIRTIQLNPKCRILYSTYHKCPLSVHQFLDLATTQGDAQRARYFHQDPNILPQKFASKNDHFIMPGAYKNFQLNRGHMAAASNYSSNQDLKNSTFSFANVVPQHGYNNGGIWNTFQRYSRNLLKQNKCDTIQIISGPIFNSYKKLQEFNEVYKNQNIVLLKNGMHVPTRLYKIIKCNTKDKTYASGFTFANQRTYDNLKNLIQFEQSLEEIQNQTGLTFNFKDKLTGKLSEYDQQGLNKPKIKYDKEFYQKLFQSALTLQDMNSTLRRAYQQRISIDEQRQKNASKIQTQGFKEYKELKENKTLSECKRLSNYLNLHKNLFYLGSDKGRFKDFSQQIEKQIKPSAINCRNTATAEQEIMIFKKIKGGGRKYRYPQIKLLSQLFSKQAIGTYDLKLQKKSSTESTSSEVNSNINPKQISFKIAAYSINFLNNCLLNIFFIYLFYDL